MHTYRFLCLLAFVYFWCAFLTISLQAQARDIAKDSNPFRKDSSVWARAKLINDSSPSLRWSSSVTVTKKDGKLINTPLKERLSRLLQLPEDAQKSLDEAFVIRQKQNEHNFKELGPIMSDQLRNARVGNPPVSLPIKELPPSKELDRMLEVYELAELKAEVELTTKLDEILNPAQFEKLVREWLTSNNLYVPLVAKYLELSDEQLEQVKVACMEKRKFQYSVNEQFPNDMAARDKYCLSSERWHELNYRALSYLTLKQFRKAAPCILISWRKSPSFKDKLEQITTDTSLQSTTELKVLGELYRKGAALELLPQRPNLERIGN